MLQPGSYTITSDQEYTYGATCYSVYANGTAINCQGHTILATNGGTFALFKSITGGTIENCTLKGFTSPITATNSSVTVLDNKISDNNTGSAAITLTNALNSKISFNNITATYQGISWRTAQAPPICSTTSWRWRLRHTRSSNSAGLTIENNTATSSSGTGLVLANTTFSSLNNNRFLSMKGIVCLGTSQANASNIDSGNNACTSNAGCAWMQSSSYSCH